MTIRRRAALATILIALFTVACGGRPTTSAPAAEGGAALSPPGTPTSSGATGRIRGIVRLSGPPPTPRSEPVTKDMGVCGSSVPITRLALGRDNGVGNAFVYLESADGHDIPVEGGARPVLTVQQKDCEYSPHAMTLETGADIEIVNDDPILHNIHARAMTPDGLETVFNIAQPIRGQRTKFDPHLKPGIVALTCEAGHPWMSAYVLVSDNPYAAITGPNGEFVIDHVPAGTYTIKMWHEGVRLKRIVASLQIFDYEDPYQETSQVVVPSGGDAHVDFDFSLRPEPRQARPADH
jgi:plastocyanin